MQRAENGALISTVEPVHSDLMGCGKVSDAFSTVYVHEHVRTNGRRHFFFFCAQRVIYNVW